MLDRYKTKRILPIADSETKDDKVSSQIYEIKNGKKRSWKSYFTLSFTVCGGWNDKNGTKNTTSFSEIVAQRGTKCNVASQDYRVSSLLCVANFTDWGERWSSFVFCLRKCFMPYCWSDLEWKTRKATERWTKVELSFTILNNLIKREKKEKILYLGRMKKIVVEAK